MVDNAEKINIIKEGKNDKNSQKQIETAIKFLQNPRVQETPLSQRKAFLAKKGLSEDEIQEALKLSQTADLNKGIILRNQAEGQAVFPGHPQPYSLQWRDFFWVALVGGSFGYLVVHLVKTYLLPYILNQKDERNEKIDHLQTSVCELKENLSQTVGGIQDTLDSVQRMLQDQQQKVQTMSLNLSTSQACLSQSMNESYSLTEIKSELSSLKGLLLNRRQFPSPVVQSSPLPSIPAWQRNDTQSQDETDVKNGNLLQENTDIGTSSDTTQCNGNDTDSSSETITIYPSSSTSCAQTVGGEKTYSNQSDSSYSTMSSDDGSPNLSMSELKDNLSDTYVKLPK